MMAALARGVFLVVLVVMAIALHTADANKRRHRHHRRGGASKGGTQSEVCGMPSEKELDDLLSGGSQVHPSLVQYPPLLESVHTLDKFLDDHGPEADHRKYTHLSHVSQGCETLVEQVKRTQTWNPCPGRWRINYDHTRHPTTLLDQSCLQCQGCQDLIAQDETAGCQPVTYYTKVLRRGPRCHPTTGNYHYLLVWEPLTVSCACRAGVNVRYVTQRPRVRSPTS